MSETGEQKQNLAKYAFWYFLSLVTLIVSAVAAGTVIFQIINKYIHEIGETYSGLYVLSGLRMAVASLVIAAPIYCLTARKINKSVFLGYLKTDAGVRRWLTYFIMLAAAVVMIGYAISVLYSFLEGELTIKFILKALTVLVIAGGIFSYYFHDIKRKEILGVKDGLAGIYAYTAVILTVAVLAAGVIFVESPITTRKKKQDAVVVNYLSILENDINRYYTNNNKLPASLAELAKDEIYAAEKDLADPVSGEKFEYKIITPTRFELCAGFQESNKEDGTDSAYSYGLDKSWRHEAGKVCFKKEVQQNTVKVAPLPAAGQ